MYRTLQRRRTRKEGAVLDVDIGTPNTYDDTHVRTKEYTIISAVIF